MRAFAWTASMVVGLGLTATAGAQVFLGNANRGTVVNQPVTSALPTYTPKGLKDPTRFSLRGMIHRVTGLGKDPTKPAPRHRAHKNAAHSPTQH